MAMISQRLSLAVQHHQAGRVRQAEEAYRDVLGNEPQNPHALHLLGILCEQTGRPAEAIQLIEQALAAHGPHPVFHNNAAAVHLKAGSLAQAEAHSRAAVALKPDLPDAHHNLGVALRRQGRYEESAAALREAVRLNPRNIDARCNLSAALQHLGRLQDALVVMQETVQLFPANAQVRNDLGGIYLAARHFDEAAIEFQEAIRLNPALIAAHNNLGMTHRDRNQTTEAIACFRAGLQLDPTYATARLNLAHTFKTLGKLEESLAEYREALRYDPNETSAISSLCQLASADKVRFTDDDVRQFQELSKRGDLRVDDLSRLHFGLGNVFDKKGDADEAFAHYRRGNELRQEFERLRGIDFDPAAHRGIIDRTIEFFTPAFFERVKTLGSTSELPIFIVGMPRSGTTLTEQILASLPRVHGAGELHEITRLITVLTERLGEQDVDYPNCLQRLDKATADFVTADLLHRLGDLGGDAKRVVDKMPFNFLHLGLIAALFPRVKIIHCRRDPVDVCLSCYFQNFGNPPPFTFDLRHLGLYYLEYERLMAHWGRVLPVTVFELRYEELTADLEKVSRDLVAFCGLEWDERCLRFHETERVVRTASILQVRQPIYRSSVGRWRRFETHLKPLLEILGK